MVKNIDDYPNPTLEDSVKFWELFSAKHPNIFNQFVTRQFINGSIIAFRPKTMNDNDNSIYERFLSRWMSDNGFKPKSIDVIYVSLDDGSNKGVRSIDTETILSINPVNDKLSVIAIKEPDMDNPVIIYVKEPVEDLRKNVYIF